MTQRFDLKDLVFLALASAALLLLGGLIMPVVMFTQRFGIQQALSAPLFSCVMCLALNKVPKPWTMTLMGIFTGTVLLFMNAVMFFNNVLAGLLSDLLTLPFFKGYVSQRSKRVAAALFIPLTLPITLLFNLWLKGRSIHSQLDHPWQSLGFVLLTILLSSLGAYLGERLALELKKAGKL